MALSSSRRRVFRVKAAKRVCMLLAFCSACVIGICATQVSKALETTNVSQQQALTTHQEPGPAGNRQQNNQSLREHTNSGNNTYLEGSDQGNSGNQGLNQGFSQNSGLNRGNQLSSQQKHTGYQQNNQSLTSSGSGGGNTTTFNGSNQGNSGNQGINTGLNQDNANNGGNQVNNQSTVIGTQINNQGTQVNNNGSNIQNQVNNITLLPPLQVGILRSPRLRLTVGLSK